MPFIWYRNKEALTYEQACGNIRRDYAAAGANGYYRFFQDDQLQATFGGGEANVAVSLANYGLDAAFVTKLPAHAIGQGAVNALRGLGVDTSGIVRGGERVGIYFLEKGASQRGSVCIYDRAHSAIQEAQPSDFDWGRHL